MGKIVIEDWSFFNDAVSRRAEHGTGAAPIAYPRPTSVPPAPPAAPARAARSGLWWPPLVAVGILLLILLIALLDDTAWWQNRWSRPQFAALPSALTPDRPPVPPAPPSGKDTAVTNYTLFHSVAFRDGEVVTGWEFAHSGDPAPSLQYCYFIRARPSGRNVLPDGSRVTQSLLGAPSSGADGRSSHAEKEQVKYDIERRPGPGVLPLPDSLAPDFDQHGWSDAARECSWNAG